MGHETYQSYVEAALTAINGMSSQYHYNLFEVTRDQAWQLFQHYVQTQPMSSLTFNYSYYGLRFQRDLPSLWPAFQYEMARSAGLV